MGKRMLAVLVAAMLGGCASLDVGLMTRFEPANNGFTYVAKTDRLVYRADSSDGEEQRVRWLERYLAENKLCPAGYRITDRKLVESPGIAPPTIYYQGACK